MPQPSNRAKRCADEEYRKFLRAAEEAVHERIPQSEGLLDTSALNGSWHPNGFATFELEFVDDLGLIRLHVWARGLRPAVSGHPEIHSHSFHLYSRILWGSYRENQFVISEATGLERDLYTLRAYRVELTGRGGPDVLHCDNRPLVATKLFPEDLIFPAGSWHDVPAGAYHSTLIPANELCVTMAVLSRHLPNISDILVGRPGFQQLSRTRAKVTRTELDELRRQIQAERERR